MNRTLRTIRRRVAAFCGIAGALALTASPVMAQNGTVDPNTVIDADLMPGAPASDTGVTGAPPAEPAPAGSDPSDPYSVPPVDNAANPASGEVAGNAAATPDPDAVTYKEDDLIGAAEGVFGKGAEGLAGIIENILKDQGEPVAYITGREASGAIGVGLRYGSGTIFHKIEGQRDVYWTGPSIGFDLGGNAAKTFVLVYNLYDSQELYKRFIAGEGAAYFIGGFNASYLRAGDVVLIPIRMGVGYRLGANVGYMKFTENRNWLPF